MTSQLQSGFNVATGGGSAFAEPQPASNLEWAMPNQMGRDSPDRWAEPASSSVSDGCPAGSPVRLAALKIAIEQECARPHGGHSLYCHVHDDVIGGRVVLPA